MTEGQVIKLANEAKCPVRGHYDENGCTPAELLRLAILVAAYAKAEERERCAKIAGRMFIRDSENYPAVIADAIRTMENGICPNDPLSIISTLKD